MHTFLIRKSTHTYTHGLSFMAINKCCWICSQDSFIMSFQWPMRGESWVMFVRGEWLTAETAARLPQEDSARCHRLHVSASPVFIIPAPCLKIVNSTTVIPLWKKIASVKALRTRQRGNAFAECIFITEIQMNFKSKADYGGEQHIYLFHQGDLKVWIKATIEENEACYMNGVLFVLAEASARFEAPL